MEKVILNEAEINRAITRMSYEILERHRGIEDLVLIGIKTRGIYIAERIHDVILKLEGNVPVVGLDITQYRDDTNGLRQKEHTNLDLTNKKVVIVDDVLFTGRSIRASLDAIMEYGRPEKVSLAVLVDRGHRELPIRPDYIGKNIPTAFQERVRVNLKEIDENDKVIIK